MYSQFRTALTNARNHLAANSNIGSMTRSRTAALATLANPHVEHDSDNSEFFINIGNQKAFIEYKQIDSVMHMEHTEVPTVFEGKGFGKLLAKVK